MQKTQENLSSADKIIEAATDLFSRREFNSVPIKDIASASGVNSALISYYFGGKKNLYQEVLNRQSEALFAIMERVQSSDAAPLEKLRSYLLALIELQKTNPHQITFIYRELFAPQPMFEGFIKNRLYKAHQFLTALVAEAIETKTLLTDFAPTHIAFTLESIIVFFFLTQKHVRTLGNFAAGDEQEYLLQTIQSYLDSLTAK